MRHIFACGVVIIVLSASSCRTGAPSQPASAGPTTRDVLAATKGMQSDYHRMMAILEFTPEQLEKFKKAIADRHRENDAWYETAEGKQYRELKQQMAAARSARNRETITRLEPQLAELEAKREEMRAELRRRFMASGALTLDQQKQWAGYVMYTGIMRRLRDVQLTEQQSAEVQRMCYEAAAAAVRRDTWKTDPYLKLPAETEQTMEKIKEKVLTPEQRPAVLPADKSATRGIRK